MLAKAAVESFIADGPTTLVLRAPRHLLSIQKAKRSQLLRICQIDEKQIGSRARKDFIENAILAHNCLVARVDQEIVGFAITDQTFFGQTFIWLLIVMPEYRRKGVATGLIRVIESNCPTRKLFTSTNSSNDIMQQLLDKLGFVPSGRIDNLDENDPELVYFKRVSTNRTK
jgi:ribosomal protein S18 acetylase RimI-like enzyme